jgi:PDDEXK-like domain of unknown function (DUF3799)
MNIIDQPGIYHIPIADYLADPCPEASFSASCGKVALQLSPLHAWLSHPRLGNTAQKPSIKADFGSVVHELVLGNGSQFRVMDVDDYRTKAAREMRDEAIAAGLTPIKSVDLERAKNAAESIRHTLSDVLTEGVAEQTMIWRHERPSLDQDGWQRTKDIWCRARPDWWSVKTHRIFDLKITGINMSKLDNTLHRHIFSMWYDLTVAHYSDGYRKLIGQELEYWFVFVEDHPPFSVRPIKLSGQGLEMGERKLRAARSLWQRCMIENQWPGIEPAPEIADPEPWMATGWLTYDSEPSTDETEQAAEFYKPLEDAQ